MFHTILERKSTYDKTCPTEVAILLALPIPSDITLGKVLYLIPMENGYFVEFSIRNFRSNLLEEEPRYNFFCYPILNSSRG